VARGGAKANQWYPILGYCARPNSLPLVPKLNASKLLDIPKDSYDFLRGILIEARLNAEVTQAQLASILGVPQSFVSKYEIGERRIDVVEFALICRALKIDSSAAVQKLDDHLAEQRK